MRPMLATRAYRFAAQASLVARVYGGYKLIQALGRVGLAGADGHYARHHRRSAEAAYRLATRLEGLPIKVCQFLGSRADILPAEYVEVLSQLQDRVPPRPLEELRPHLERELGGRLDEVFATLEPAPLASASLAQVHRGRLRDGREVAVKIQYPEIADLVAIDLQNFAVLVGLLARLEPDFDFRVVLDEVRKYVPLELDFVHEADNAERMGAHLAARPDVLVPPVVREWSTRRVLVMDYAPGVRVTDVAGLRALGLDPPDVARRLLELFCEQLLVHGFFHADPHPGNILLRRRDAAPARHEPARRDPRRRPPRRARHGTPLRYRQAARFPGRRRRNPPALPSRRRVRLGARPTTRLQGGKGCRRGDLRSSRARPQLRGDAAAPRRAWSEDREPRRHPFPPPRPRCRAPRRRGAASEAWRGSA
ncbi:MAG: hypothetical protein E6J83_09505 [Deltaproteobacteria bacterium]|nr:MAG: hypothetical protein E6J83_09505 [Deltaproteobacteria bacterium]